MKSLMNKKKTKMLPVYIALSIGALIMLIPFIWMILTSVKTQAEAISVNPFYFFPTKLNFEAFGRAFVNNNFVRLYYVTLSFIVIRLLTAVLFSATAAYAFARLNFPGKNLFFFLVLLQMMVPPQIFIIPQYMMVNKLGLRNTILALAFPGLVSAYGTFLLRQFFKNLPTELEEAARLDGCNICQTFFLVMLPLVKSGLIALGIFTALFAFKDLLWALVINSDQSFTTLSAALSRMANATVVDYPELMATAVISILPMVIIYFIFQKQLIQGIATSGGKL